MRFEGFKVIGHRGFPARFPENTLLSFRKALEAGADGFELDVRITGDGVPVVLHDEDTKRTTGAAKELGRLTLKELRQLDAGQGERVPTLDEVLTWAKTTNAIVALELKEPEPSQAAVELAAKHRMQERCVFASFWPDYLEAPRAKGFVVGFLAADELDESLGLAKGLGAKIFLPSFSLLSRGVVARAEEQGMATVPWTVNDPNKLRAVKRWGCAAVITDRPDRAVAVRDGPR